MSSANTMYFYIVTQIGKGKEGRKGEKEGGKAGGREGERKEKQAVSNCLPNSDYSVTYFWGNINFIF